MRLTGRDIGGLLPCWEMYAAPYDLLASFLGVREDRLRAIVARWRRAGYVVTERRSERKIRRAVGPRVGTGHIPDAEISWPEVPGSAYAGELWAVEAELTAKTAARTIGIMAGLLARTADYQPGAPPGSGPGMRGWCTSAPRPRAAWSAAPPLPCPRRWRPG